MSTAGGNRSRIAWTPAVLALAAGSALGAAAMYFGGAGLLGDRTPTPGGTRPLPEKTRVSALGRLEPSKGVVAVYGPPGDRIEKLLVSQGEKVTTDTVLVELASRKDRNLERELVQTQLAEARAQRGAIERAGQAKIAAIDAEIVQIQSGRESDLKAQDARVNVLELQAKRTNDNWMRLKSLTKTTVPAQDLENAELAMKQAEAEVTGAKALRTKTATGYEQSEAVAQAKRRAASAELEEAIKRVPVASLEDNLKLADRRLELTRIKAPVAGTVLRLIGHEGDATGTQPILQIADTDHLVVVAEVYETDIQQLDAWLGKGSVFATITSRAIPGQPLVGELKRDHIARMIAKNQLFSLNPREDVDRRVVEVRVPLQADGVERASSLIGLEVQVEFQPGAKP